MITWVQSLPAVIISAALILANGVLVLATENGAPSTPAVPMSTTPSPTTSVEQTTTAALRLADATKSARQAAERALDRANASLAQQPGAPVALSQRADALFQLGRFADAVRDYDRMVEHDPELDASHWRRGIAYFYAGDYPKAAAQFERYHTFDQIDRENGIWRYLSQVKAHGRERARAGLLKYEKDDREPFPDVYKLFAGQITPEAILQNIAAAEISAEEREKRLFYAELYIGLNAAVENQPDVALRHLLKSVDNRWGPVAGYGPRYMWHVGRLHAELLTTAANSQPDSAPVK